MSKLKNKSIVLAPIILAIFTLGLISFMPNVVSAKNVHYGPSDSGSDSTAPRVDSQNPSDGLNYQYIQNSAYSPTVSPNLASPSTYTYSNTTYEKKTAKSDTVKKEEGEQNLSSLAANALFGGSSFMPSSLVQWLLFIILVLFLVLLVRKTIGKEKEYHSTPLKHE